MHDNRRCDDDGEGDQVSQNSDFERKILQFCPNLRHLTCSDRTSGVLSDYQLSAGHRSITSLQFTCEAGCSHLFFALRALGSELESLKINESCPYRWPDRAELEEQFDLPLTFPRLGHLTIETCGPPFTYLAQVFLRILSVQPSGVSAVPLRSLILRFNHDCSYCHKTFYSIAELAELLLINFLGEHLTYLKFEGPYWEPLSAVSLIFCHSVCLCFISSVVSVLFRPVIVQSSLLGYRMTEDVVHDVYQ